MRIRNILPALLAVLLSACQPETPAPKAAAPEVVAAPPAAPHAEAPVAAQPASEAAVPVPAMKSEPAVAEKTARPPVREKPAAAAEGKTPPQAIAEKPAPAKETAAPPAKVEPPPVAVEAKPETKPVPAVSEAEAMQLAKKNNCFACHAVDKKVVGPSFRDVAAKYRGDAGAEARLADKIARGGSGAWGAMVMPPSPQIGEADRRILAAYVLSLK